MFKRYGLYLVRWQLSTPILAVCVSYFVGLGNLWATVIANLVGGLIFFWVDRFIFTSPLIDPVWSIRDNIACVDCGTVARGYRLVYSKNYDRRRDAHPEFRCEHCSQKKLALMKQQGIETE